MIFEDLQDIKEFLRESGEELSMEEAWEIVNQQQILDILIEAYHY